MRKLLFIGLTTLLAACDSKEKNKEAYVVDMDNEVDKISYSYGVTAAKNIIDRGGELNPEAVVQGILDVQAGEERVNLNEASMFINKYLGDVRKRRGQANIDEGEKFLEENAEEDEVVVLESGLQYKVIEEGSGRSPGATDTVTTHYTGRLIDGTVFDSSVERGEPAQFPVNGVIAGWQEALQLMKEGSKWELYVPADLAYGYRGSGPLIGPYKTLIFEVELISVDSQ